MVGAVAGSEQRPTEHRLAHHLLHRETEKDRHPLIEVTVVDADERDEPQRTGQCDPPRGKYDRGSQRPEDAQHHADHQTQLGPAHAEQDAAAFQRSEPVGAFGNHALLSLPRYVWGGRVASVRLP